MVASLEQSQSKVVEISNERAAYVIQIAWRKKLDRRDPIQRVGTMSGGLADGFKSLTRSYHMPRVDMTPAKIIGAANGENVSIIAMTLGMPLWQTLSIGVTFSLLTCVIFAGFFVAAGEDCFSIGYEYEGNFYEEMLWLSVHTWSTVGYGSVFPTCWGSQMVVFIECYVVIMVNTVLMGVVLYQFLVARPKVRFSKSILRCVAPDGCPMIVFRMCRLSHDLRDLTCNVQVPFSVIENGEVVGEIAKNIEFVSKSSSTNRLATLDQWTLYHRIDENSPLKDDPMLQSPSLRGFFVSIVGFETSYCVEARVYKTYSYTDIVHGKEFASMTKYYPAFGKQGVLQPVIDLSKVDLIEGVTEPNGSPPAPPASSRSGKYLHASAVADCPPD